MERLARDVGLLFHGGADRAHQGVTDRRLQEVVREMGALERALAEASRPNRALLARGGGGGGGGHFFHTDADRRPKRMKLGVFAAEVEGSKRTTKLINWVRLLAVIRNATLAAVLSSKSLLKNNTIKYFESVSQFNALKTLDVTVDSLPYFQRLTSLIEDTAAAATAAAAPSDELLVNYLRWAAIHRYHHLVGGRLRAIFAGHHHHQAEAEVAGAPVVKRCTDLVATVYPWRLTRRYVTSAFLGEPVRQAARQLVDEVAGKFSELLLQPEPEAAAWLPKRGAEEAAKRLAALSTTIGAPRRWLLDHHAEKTVDVEDFAVEVGEETAYAGFSKDLEELFGRIVARSLDRMLRLERRRQGQGDTSKPFFHPDGPVFSTELRYDSAENHLSE